MSEITGITGIDNSNVYNSSAAKKPESSGFSSFLGESKSMDSIFDEAAKKYNIPVNLLKAVGKAESNFNAKAVSRCGAQGVMQLMPGTAKELGVTDAFDAEQNIMGGAKYLSGLLKKYQGDTQLTLAAYNAGAGNVAKYDGIPPFKETQNYVKKVINYMGEDNIEIAGTNNTVTTKNTTTSRYSSTLPPTSIHRNLSFIYSNDNNSSTNEVDDLNELFSYEDYMNFIELFLKDNDEKESQKNQEETSQSFTSNSINYNVPIMNLLKNQDLL